MQREIRRKDRQLTTEEALKLLETAEYGVLSTINTDGTPYGVPLNYLLSEHKIYFHCASVGQKIDNITANSNVSFVVVGETQPVVEGHDYSTYYESAFAAGKANIVTDPEEKLNSLRKLTEKYFPERMDVFEQSISGGTFERIHMVAIDIEYITGKSKRKK